MTTAKNEILFIDANVLDKESLIAELSSNIHVVVLDDKTPVINQIATVLEGYQNLDAIHIVSHGAEGELVFANGIINNANVSDYATQLKRIGSSLSANGDLLLYGCNVAKGDDGLAFINTLADLTGSDVAASDDLTGKSGDWVLEQKKGVIESTILTALNYQNRLFSYEAEGNGTITTANAMALGAAITGQLSTSSDTDYYKFTTSSSGLVSLVFDSPTNSAYTNYFQLSLYNASNTLLNQFSTGIDKTYQVAVPTAGTYYVAIDSTYSYSGDSYNLTANYAASASIASTAAQPSAQTPPTGQVLISGLTQQNQILTINTTTIADINGLGAFT